MTALQAAAFWIGLNAIFLIIISANVGRMRSKHKINLGDGENSEMTCAIRAQGNYIEYAPVVLLGLMALGALGAAVWFIHVLGAVFLGGRIAHFLDLGLGKFTQGRMIGTILTMVTLLTTAIGLVVSAFA